MCSAIILCIHENIACIALMNRRNWSELNPVIMTVPEYGLHKSNRPRTWSTPAVMRLNGAALDDGVAEQLRIVQERTILKYFELLIARF